MSGWATVTPEGGDLESIRELLNAARQPGPFSPLRAATFRAAYLRDVSNLLAELGALRAQLAECDAQVGALRGVVEAAREYERLHGVVPTVHYKRQVLKAALAVLDQAQTGPKP